MFRKDKALWSASVLPRDPNVSASPLAFKNALLLATWELTKDQHPSYIIKERFRDMNSTSAWQVADNNRAGDGDRTRDVQLGKLALN